MKFLRRKVQGTETVREEGRVMHREIEITMEREWIAMQTADGPLSETMNPAAERSLAEISMQQISIPKTRGKR